jgi:beta-lactamase regulating signal transducer with metallopeptidase domain/Flp pilus assembly protein TadD
MRFVASAAEFAAGLLVRSTLLFLLAGAALLLLRRSGAAARHRVATAGLAAALALPVLSATLPPISVALPRLAMAQPRFGFAATLLVLWTAGAAAVAVRFFVGFARVRRLSRDASVLRDDEWLVERDAAARRLDVRRQVVLKESTEVPIAITSGWRRPFLLVGRAARFWAVERRRVVLLHELAHVKRSDWLALVVAEAAVAVYWFHPLAQWLGRRARREAEQACDELVIAAGTKPSVYAGHLLGIFRSLGAASQPMASALPLARPHHFEARLRAILDPRGGAGAATPGRTRAAVAGLLAASAAVVMVRPASPEIAVVAAARPVASVTAAPSNPAKATRTCRSTHTETVAATRERRETATQTEIRTDENDMPALPEKGESFPAIWRVQGREPARPGAEGFVRASNSRKSPRDGGDWYDRGMQLHRRGKYEQAIEAFGKAIEDGYREDASSYNIACGYALLGNKDKAFEWLHKAMEEGFDLASYLKDDDLEDLHGDPRWGQLKQSAREAKSDEDKAEGRRAAARYERLVAKDPTGGEPYFNQGRELLRADQYALAAKAYQTSADRGYRAGTSLYNAACAQSLDGKKDAALDLLQRALDAGFDQPDMFRSDDDLDNVRDDPRFAAIAREAKDLELPGYNNGPWNWGSHSDRKKWRDAAQRFQVYAEKYPQNGRAWYNLGFSLLAGDRAEEAAPAFRKALELGYRKPETLYNLACTYARLDQKDAAFDWLFKAIDAGFDQTWTMRFDDDLDNLRGDSRYRKAVEIARAHDKASEKD